jgi:hypothetical protein
MSKQPRSNFLGARVTTETFVQLKNISKATGEPLSKVTADVIRKGLGKP